MISLPSARVGQILWSAALVVAAAWGAWLEYLVVKNTITTWPVFRTDFAVFYTAVRVPPDVIYDAARMTAAQAWLGADASKLRPFPYPPTFLLFLWPFGRLELLPALVAWVGLGLSAYCIATWKLIGRMWPILLLSPTVAVAAVTGQVTFLMGAALMAGVIWLPARPIVAGVIFGLAATVKPQVLALVPFAMAFSGAWRALGASVITGTLIGLLSLAVHKGIWLDWLHAIAGFNDLISREAWAVKISATPAGFLQGMGVMNGFALGAIRIVSAIAAIALTFRAFRRDDPIARYGALVLGYLLVSPYALWYELALLQPLAVRALVDRRWPSRIAGLLAFTLFARGVGVVALAITPFLDRPQTRLRAREAQADSGEETEDRN